MVGRTYLREWRKHRAKTQKQVADALASLEDPQLPTTEATLSRIETGKIPYSQRLLEALADIYSCEPWELLGRHPGKAGRVYDLLARMNDQQLVQAEAVVNALAESDDLLRAAEKRQSFGAFPKNGTTD